MNKFLLVLLALIFLLVLSACAPGPNRLENMKNPEGEVAGFWQGLWHGIIAPVTFIISLFNDNVNMYEVYNNGGWYNLGFAIGAMIITGGGSRGAGRVSSRRKTV
jgi:hypothetical protein